MNKNLIRIAKEHSDATLVFDATAPSLVAVGETEIPIKEYDALVEISALCGTTPEEEIVSKRVEIEFGNVKSYDLSGRMIEELPSSIGNFRFLKSLFLEENRLSGLPESIGNLVNLERLIAYNNNISSIPKSVGRLFSIKNMDLDNNPLEAVPGEIYSLTKLERFDTYGNRFDRETRKRLLEELPSFRENYKNCADGTCSGFDNTFFDCGKHKSR